MSTKTDITLDHDTVDEIWAELVNYSELMEERVGRMEDDPHHCAQCLASEKDDLAELDALIAKVQAKL